MIKTGPIVEPKMDGTKELTYNKNHLTNKLSFIGQAVSHLHKELQDDIPIIGFCASPWTLATYMIEGKKANNINTREPFYTNTTRC